MERVGWRFAFCHWRALQVWRPKPALSWSGNGSSIEGAPPGGGLSPMRENECLAFWVYNETPSEMVLYLDLMRGGEILGSCWYLLGFKGWRPLAAPYGHLYRHNEHFVSNPSFPGVGQDQADLAAQSRRGGRSRVRPALFRPVQLRLRRQAKARPSAAVDRKGDDALGLRSMETHLRHPRHLSKRPWLRRLVPEGEITAEERKSMELILERCVSGDSRLGDAPKIPKAFPGKEDATALDEFRDRLQIRRSPLGMLTDAR